MLLGVMEADSNVERVEKVLLADYMQLRHMEIVEI